jgi:Fe(3+) dicitrate transport protein
MGNSFQSQNFDLNGLVIDSISGENLSGVLVMVDQNIDYSEETNLKGEFLIEDVKKTAKVLTFIKSGYVNKDVKIDLQSYEQGRAFMLKPIEVNMDEVIITGKEAIEAMTPMSAVSGLGIYSGMKSEVIRLDNITANLSSNNSRQVYNRIAGLNIWENDGAGIQLGIGARGLSPNRTSNFNVRQNHYDISADALGYPESYYTPALQGVNRIELIRGAAALQYGTQFGGLLNFEMKSPPKEKGTEVLIDQSIGSFGLTDTLTSALASSTTFVSVGSKGKKSGFYGYYQYKQGEGWRERSDYDVHSVFATFVHDFNDKWMASLDFTHMSYLAEQAGGLTDDDFEANPRLTKRYRNWFKVNWNILSSSLVYEHSSTLMLETKVFKLLASRDALGFLGQADRPDPQGERDLISSSFNNLGLETRLIKKREVENGFRVFATGFRLYNGESNTIQGLGALGDEDDFTFNDEILTEKSDYDFPNMNVAAYFQTLLPISNRLSITPGLRYEYIKTESEGSFRNIVRDGANNVIEDTLLFDSQSRQRDFVLWGVGLSYKTVIGEIYANANQNYKAINFTDIQVKNTSQVIDPNIQDERGYNFDIGFRGWRNKTFQYDISGFALLYSDKIGEYNTVIPNDMFNSAIRLRTNISDAQTMGAEMFAQYELIHLFNEETAKHRLNYFVNASFIDSKYINSEITAFDDKLVELVPQVTIRTGLEFQSEKINASLQYSFVDSQFSDATNVGASSDNPSTPNAVHGIIPSYNVVDLSLAYKLEKLKLSLSVNNLLNQA